MSGAAGLVCDTHVLLWDALDRSKIARRVRRRIDAAADAGALACADISLWEIAWLLDRGRLRIKGPVREFIDTLVARRGLRVLPITATVAVRAAQLLDHLRDPVDSLIAATALTQGSPLVSADDRIAQVRDLTVLW